MADEIDADEVRRALDKLDANPSGWVDACILNAAAAWLVEREKPQHHWFWDEQLRLTACRDCGICRRADDQNGPCRGKVRVTLREKPQAASGRAAVRRFSIEVFDGGNAVVLHEQQPLWGALGTRRLEISSVEAVEVRDLLLAHFPPEPTPEKPQAATGDDDPLNILAPCNAAARQAIEEKLLGEPQAASEYAGYERACDEVLAELLRLADKLKPERLSSDDMRDCVATVRAVQA